MTEPTKSKWDYCSSKSKDPERLQELHQTTTFRFNPEVVNELSSKTQDFSDMECFPLLMFDEMKVREDLVLDKNTGNLLFYIL